MMMGHFFKGLNCSIENKGKELVVTIKGDSKKLVKVEKKLKAFKEFCSCCDEDGDKGHGCC